MRGHARLFGVGVGSEVKGEVHSWPHRTRRPCARSRRRGTRNASTISISTSRLTSRRTATIRAGLDRKSTRLNSSHVSISYAVFCLKKNKSRDYLEPGEQVVSNAHL